MSNKIKDLKKISTSLYKSNKVKKSIYEDAIKEEQKYKQASKHQKQAIIKRVDKKIDNLQVYKDKKYNTVSAKNYADIRKVNINNIFDKNYVDLLFDNRKALYRRQIIQQDEIVQVAQGAVLDSETDEILNKFDKNISQLIQKAVNRLFSNDKVASALLQIKYCVIAEFTDDETDEKWEEVVAVRWTDPSDKPNIDKSNIDEVIDKFRKEFRASNVRVYMIGYRIPFFMKVNNVLTKKDIYSIKAYAATKDRAYHELTSESTSDSKLCIYETYLCISGRKKLKYIRDNQTTYDEMYKLLEEEGEEIEKEVMQGNLVRSLELITKKYNCDATILFHENKRNPIYINNGETKEILKTDILLGSNVYYHDGHKHVAPAVFGEKHIIKDKNDELRKSKYNKPLFKLRPYIRKTYTKVKNVIGFDSEVFRDKDNMSKVYSITAYGELDGEHIEEPFYGLDAVEKFVDWLDAIKTKKDTKKSRPKGEISDIYIYGFNNSNFDNLFIYEQLFKKYDKTIFSFCGNSIKYIEYYNIKIFDMRLFYSRGTLSKVCEDFDIEDKKMTYPYDFVNESNLYFKGYAPDVKYWKDKEDLYKYVLDNGITFNMEEYTNKYCMMDSKLVYQLAKKHIDMCQGVIGDKKYCLVDCKTVSSMSEKQYQQIFQQEIIMASPPVIREKERRRYKAGRTEVFKKEFISIGGKKMYYIDINSSYAISMTKMMPWEYLSTTKHKDKILKIEDITPYNGYVAKSRYIGTDIYVIPNLLIRDGLRNATAKNTEYADHWGCELIEAIKNGFEITIIEEDHYSCKDIFRTFIEYNYNERKKYKGINGAKDQFYKNMLTSLYGKFAQKEYDRTEMIKLSVNMTAEELEEYNMIMQEIPGKKTQFNVLEEHILVSYKDETNEEGSLGDLVRFSSYIAALGRCQLSEIMRAIGHEHIYYCDTDSIFCDVEPPKEFLDDEELGKWKVESSTITHAIFLAPKVYCYVDYRNKRPDKREVMKIKGIESKDTTIEDFKRVHKGENETIKHTQKMFIRSLDKGVKIVDQERTIKSIYNKRIWPENDNNSYALENI